ncbi:MAG: T9SS type A sorting domain-containing protein, partial [Bacteroidota bacterium]
NWKNGVPNEFMTAIIPSATSVTNQPVISSYEEFLDNPAKAFDVRLEENSHLILSDHARLEIYGGLIAETGAIFDAFNIPSNSTNSEVVFYQAQAEIQSRVDVSFANLSFANTVEEVVTNYPLVVHRNFDLSKAVLSFLDDSNKNGGKDYVQIESGGAITYTEGRVVGMIRHFIQEDATGMPVQLPVGTMDNNRWVRVEYESGPGPANQGYLEARFIPFSGTYDPFTDVDDFYSNVNFSGGIPDEDLVVNTLSEQGIWHIAPMAGGDGVKNGTVSLAFSTCGIPWIIAPQDVRMVARKPGETDWKILGNHVSPDEILPDVYWINRQGIPSLGDSQNPGYLAHTYWAMGSNHEINPLPIELVSFTATCAEDAILVQWTTATETNNSHFLLERAYSDGSFELIAHIEGGGNTSQLTEYMYNDQPANDGSVIYYRLSQYDFDGQYEVFAPIALECSNVLSEGGVNVFPNPASSYVTLETISPLQTQAIAEIYTLSGVLVLQQPMEVFPGLNTQSLRIEHLQQGLYLLKVTARDVNFGTRRLYVR